MAGQIVSFPAFRIWEIGLLCEVSRLHSQCCWHLLFPSLAGLLTWGYIFFNTLCQPLWDLHRDCQLQVKQNFKQSSDIVISGMSAANKNWCSFWTFCCVCHWGLGSVRCETASEQEFKITQTVQNWHRIKPFIQAPDQHIHKNLTILSWHCQLFLPCTEGCYLWLPLLGIPWWFITVCTLFTAKLCMASTSEKLTVSFSNAHVRVFSFAKGLWAAGWCLDLFFYP